MTKAVSLTSLLQDRNSKTYVKIGAISSYFILSMIVYSFIIKITTEKGTIWL